MNFSARLDRYLTTPPNDGFDSYFENVTEKLSNDFFEENEEWVMESLQYENWVEKCLNKGLSPINSAKIIERAFNKYQN